VQVCKRAGDDGSEVRQESAVTFVMTSDAGGMWRIIEYSTEISRGISICFVREAIWSMLWRLAQNLKAFPLRQPECISLTFSGLSARSAISSPGSALPPNTFFGGNAVVYLN
jgi:hypothetical protein